MNRGGGAKPNTEMAHYPHIEVWAQVWGTSSNSQLVSDRLNQSYKVSKVSKQSSEFNSSTLSNQLWPQHQPIFSSEPPPNQLNKLLEKLQYVQPICAGMCAGLVNIFSGPGLSKCTQNFSVKAGLNQGLVQLCSSFVLLAELFSFWTLLLKTHILSDWTCNRLDCVEHFVLLLLRSRSETLLH